MNRLAILAAVALRAAGGVRGSSRRRRCSTRDSTSATQGRCVSPTRREPCGMGAGLLTDAHRHVVASGGLEASIRGRSCAAKHGVRCGRPPSGDLPRGDIDVARRRRSRSMASRSRCPPPSLNGAVAPADTLALRRLRRPRRAARHLERQRRRRRRDRALERRARRRQRVERLHSARSTLNLAPRDGRLAGRIGNRGGDVRIDGDFAWGVDGIAVNVDADAAALDAAGGRPRARRAGHARCQRRRARAMARRPALT